MIMTSNKLVERGVYVSPHGKFYARVWKMLFGPYDTVEEARAKYEELKAGKFKRIIQDPLYKGPSK